MTSSTIAIAHTGKVTRVAVRLSVLYGYDADVDLGLVSPELALCVAAESPPP